MTKTVAKALCKIFNAEVSAKAKLIDRDEEYDWFSISLGWALAKGFSPREAYDFAIYARYTDRYGKPREETKI